MRYIYVFLEQSSKWSENNEHLNEKKLEKPLKYQIEIELKSKTKSSLFSQSRSIINHIIVNQKFKNRFYKLSHWLYGWVIKTSMP